MNNSKKTLSILLVLSLLITLVLSNIVQANDEIDTTKPYISVTTQKVVAGDTVKVTASINNNPGVWGVKFGILLDERLKVVYNTTTMKTDLGVNFVDGLTNNPNESTVTYVYTSSNTSDVSSNGELFSFYVNVPDNCVDGDFYNMTFDSANYEIINSSADDVEFQFKNGTLYTEGANTTTVTSTTVATTSTTTTTTTTANSTVSTTANTTSTSNTTATTSVSQGPVVYVGSDQTTYTNITTSSITAASGGTMVLTTDISPSMVSGGAAITLGNAKSDITIDLNGHTISTSNPRCVDTAEISSTARTITFKNGTINHTGTAVGFFVRANVNLVLDNITMTTTATDTYGVVCFRVNSSRLASTCTIKNSTITGNSGSMLINNGGPICNVTVQESSLNTGVNIAKNITGVTVSESVLTRTSGNFNSSDFKNVTVADDNTVSNTQTGSQIEGIVSNNLVVPSVAQNYSTLYFYKQSQTDCSVDLSMEYGAAIRLNSQNGIRFYTNVDTDKIAELRELGATVEMGTLITTSDILGTNSLDFDLTSDYADVAFNSSEYYTENSFTGIVGSIVNIKESTDENPTSGNITRQFIGRGYVKVTLNGQITISYASYYNNDISNNARSLAFVSNKLKNDTDSYNNLTADRKVLVDNWAKYFVE